MPANSFAEPESPELTTSSSSSVTSLRATSLSATPLSASPLSVASALDQLRSGEPATIELTTALLSARGDDLENLLALATQIRDEGLLRAGRPGVITYSKKVFLPITQLCQDRCHYCIFVDTPGGLARNGIPTYMEPDAILAIAQTGAGMGCKEALFTLGDRPENRWPVARKWLTDHGYTSTLEYVAAMAQLVLDETGLIPHLNPGVMSWNEMQRLRPFAGSMGMMLETTAARLWTEPGGAHYGSPDKDPALRLRVIEDAGRSRIPFTTGVLLGIGENHFERAEALFAIRDLHNRFGHVQETIVQNFRAKPRTAMQNDPDLGLDEYIAAVAAARVVMGPDATVQAPPNLTDINELDLLIRAGINDWGGMSPLTADHVNPERPWPEIDLITDLTARSGYTLKERLTAYPNYLADADRWLDPNVAPALEALMDPATLLADEKATVRPRNSVTVADQSHFDGFNSAPNDATANSNQPLRDALDAASLAATSADPASASSITDEQAVLLLSARGADLVELAGIADSVRAATGDNAITYAVNRNINTALLTGSDAANGEDASAQSEGDVASPAHPLALTLGMVTELVDEAVSLGATEICLQGMPASNLPGEIYLDVVRTVRAAAPDITIHGFRPTELQDGAHRLGIPLEQFLGDLRSAGLSSVPGTAAVILNDDVRAIFSEGALPPAADWIATIEAAHRAGLGSTATLVYGHVETPQQIVEHLRTLAAIQDRTGGFSEFIPMPFVPGDAPRAVAAVAGDGPSPSFSRAVIAVSRLLLAGRINHVQAAWTKLGFATTADVLKGGADDIGGVLLDGKLWPEAGPEARLTLTDADVASLAEAAGRPTRQRGTDYAPVTPVATALASESGS
ncbi:MAG: 2-phospho-L-lactate guanylyltransferase [Glaciihabitans sp.]|nr:2-phospho-L-lactate guanylyltransferase [Glaciihabitans sp.]